MGTVTSTSTLAPGASRTFNLAPASAVSLTLLPNCRVTVTETPAVVASSPVGGNAPRVHNLRYAGVVTYGPYAMGGTIVVSNDGNSGSTLTWTRTDALIAEDVNGVSSVVSAAGISLFPGKPTASAGTLITDWQSNGTLSLISSNGGGEAVALDPSVLCDGLPMLKCTLGNSGTYQADFLLTTPVNAAQLRTLQIPIRWSSNNAAFTGASNSVQIWLYDDATGTRQWRTGASLRALDATEMRPGVTHVISMAAGAGTQGWSFGGTSAPTNTSDLDSYQITRVRVVIAVPASVAGEAVWFGGTRFNGRAVRPCVSIVLDGEYSSQHSYILPMLESVGLRASLALTHANIGTGGRMTDAQIDRAYQWGHEVIHHTFGASTNGYQNSTNWPDAAAITADINAGQAYQAARGWTRGLGYAVHGYTHPYGAAISAARQAIVTAGYQAAGIKALRRGNNAASAVWFDRCQSVARPACVDPYSVQGALQITSTHNAASVTGQIGRAKALGELAVITVHRSVVTSPGSLEMLNSDFQTWISSLGADAQAGAIDVLPFGEACRQYGITT